ncbi:MAG: hypothetical protein WCK39_05225 [Methanomassiliicoccales archaeon]
MAITQDLIERNSKAVVAVIMDIGVLVLTAAIWRRRLPLHVLHNSLLHCGSDIPLLGDVHGGAPR